MTQTKTASKSHKRYKINPYIERLAQPQRGLITAKYRSPDQLLYARGDHRRRGRRCRQPYLCQPANAPPPSERLVRLAQPRSVTKKYSPRKYRMCRCACPTVIRPGECSTRTEELALPYVWTLVSRKKEFRPVLSKQRAGIFNKSIQKSMHTVYSRLANVKMPERRKLPSQWSPKEWAAYNEWAETRAKPKRTFSETQTPRKYRPINYMHVDTISRPKRPVPIYTDPGTKISDPVHPIKPAVLNFQMTPHYEWLAKPFKTIEPDDQFEPYENPYDVPRDYARITSIGVKALAEPRRGIKAKRFQRGDNASVVFEVSKMARQAKPSELTKKLAEPRKDLQTGPKPNPFGVAKAAVSKKPMPKPKVEYYAKLATPVKR